MASNGTNESGVSALTDEQVGMIRETWKLVKLDLQSAGIVMFIKLFEIAPELQKMFPFRDEVILEENEALKGHAMQVMESIDAAVDQLDDPQLEETLEGLGIAHNINETPLTEKHFGVLGQALVYALQDGLKEKFTEDVMTAWVTLYKIIQHHMLMGIENGL